MITLFTITEGDMTAMLGYVSDVFTDFSPILMVIVGVSLALLVISVIINAIKN